MTVLDPVLGAACLVAGLLALVRVRRDGAAAVAHALMGLGMAAMFVPAADPLPRGAWLAVFVATAAGAAVAAARSRAVTGEAGHHLVGSAAMVFMLLVHGGGAPTASAAGEGGHHAAGGEVTGALPLLVAVVALAFAAWFVTDTVRVLARPGGAAPATAAPVAVRERVPVRVVARVVMNLAMVVMLVGMT